MTLSKDERKEMRMRATETRCWTEHTAEFRIATDLGRCLDRIDELEAIAKSAELVVLHLLDAGELTSRQANLKRRLEAAGYLKGAGE